MRRAKRLGFSDEQLGIPAGGSPSSTSGRLGWARTHPGDLQGRTDTCGAEFVAHTPRTTTAPTRTRREVRPSTGARVIILGSGPNRIGQGIEFDYCCVHASMALREAGFETVMVNCNPETVSTDYDVSNRLYFEPLTPEDVANVVDAEERASATGGRVVGVVVALGGQTPLKLAGALPPDLVLGTSPASIDLAEDREQWNTLCSRLGIAQPAGGTATTVAQALAVADRIGYPVLLRPSYVLGGRAMEIVYDADGVRRVMAGLTGTDGTAGLTGTDGTAGLTGTDGTADQGSSAGRLPSGTSILAREGGVTVSRPVLVDRFLEDATEVDVDAVRIDHTGEVLIAGVMEHVEQAGVHSGDSACALPPQTLTGDVVADLERQTRALADALDVRGLINVQYAVKDGQTFVLEANPRAEPHRPLRVEGDRECPLAMRGGTGDGWPAPWMASAPKACCRRPPEEASRSLGHVSVKEAVLPFDRFPASRHPARPRNALDRRGDGGGRGRSGFGFCEEPDGCRHSVARIGDRVPPRWPTATSRVRARWPGSCPNWGSIRWPRPSARPATCHGTAASSSPPGLVAKVGEEGLGTDAVQLIAQGQVQMVINTPRGRGSRADGAHIRAAATALGIPCLTTIAAARAAAAGIADQATHPLRVRSLQELHGLVEPTPAPTEGPEVGGSAVEGAAAS